MNKIVYIYGLREVGLQEYRYAGKTDSPKSRFKGHCNNTFSGLKKCEWIKSVISRSAKLEMVIFEECDQANVKEREQYWIKRGLMLNHRLTNRIYNYSTLSQLEEHSIYGPLYPLTEIPPERILQAWVQGWDKLRESDTRFNMDGLLWIAREQNMIATLDNMLMQISNNYPRFNREGMKFTAEIF